MARFNALASKANIQGRRRYLRITLAIAAYYGVSALVMGVANTRSIRPLEAGEVIWRTPSSEISFLQFVDPTHGWFVANERLYRSLDGGYSWSSSSLPESETPVSFRMSSNVIGLLATRRRVYKTLDAGVKWSLIWVPASEGADLEVRGAICIPSKEDRCFVFGAEYEPSYDAAPAYARETTDLRNPRVARPLIYGTTALSGRWTKFEGTLSGFVVEDLRFFSGQNGALLTDQSAFWTGDSGMSWHPSAFPKSRRAEMNPDRAPQEGGLATSTWQSPGKGWASYRDGGLFRTDDKGRTWRRLCSVGQDGDMATLISMLPGGIGAAVTSMQSLLQTSDGGKNWKLIRSPNPGSKTFPQTGSIVSVFALDLEHVWYCTSEELIRTRFRHPNR